MRHTIDLQQPLPTRDELLAMRQRILDDRAMMLEFAAQFRQAAEALGAMADESQAARGRPVTAGAGH